MAPVELLKVDLGPRRAAPLCQRAGREVEPVLVSVPSVQKHQGEFSQRRLTVGGTRARDRVMSAPAREHLRVEGRAGRVEGQRHVRERAARLGADDPSPPPTILRLMGID